LNNSKFVSQEAVEYDIITGPMQLFYDILRTAEGATAQMESASHSPDNTRPSFNKPMILLWNRMVGRENLQVMW
jgi:hypothetical protein